MILCHKLVEENSVCMHGNSLSVDVVAYFGMAHIILRSTSKRKYSDVYGRELIRFMIEFLLTPLWILERIF